MRVPRPFGRRQEERHQRGEELCLVNALQGHASAIALQLRAEVDQRPAGEIDALVHVVPDEVVERRPPEKRTDNPGARDRNGEWTLHTTAEWQDGPIPQLDRSVEVEFGRQQVYETPGGLKLPSIPFRAHRSTRPPVARPVHPKPRARGLGYAAIFISSALALSKIAATP